MRITVSFKGDGKIYESYTETLDAFDLSTQNGRQAFEGFLFEPLLSVREAILVDAKKACWAINSCLYVGQGLAIKKMATQEDDLAIADKGPRWNFNINKAPTDGRKFIIKWGNDMQDSWTTAQYTGREGFEVDNRYYTNLADNFVAWAYAPHW